MKHFLKLFSVFTLMLSMGLVACTEGGDEENEPGGSKPGGIYGTLGGNLITIGSTKDVTYTSCVLLGTVDFPKITSDHKYGIVFMEALQNPDFDYGSKLQVDGHSDRTDKEPYECIKREITNSAADGKFEKQLINLKPATRYYYRAYVLIGQNVNYSSVEYFTTKDPTSEITLATYDASDVYAVAATFNGACAVGNLQDINEDQEYGFIYSTDPKLSTADKLTYEWWREWNNNHFETDDEIERPEEITTNINLNGRINCKLEHTMPGITYYYRSFFKWNDKYFYSPEVKSVTTNGSDKITVGTGAADEVTARSATFHATVPFSLIGLPEVEGGFMISKKYSNASEFNMEEAEPWNNRHNEAPADVYYVELGVNKVDFSYAIKGLSPETTYYVCAYICLGEYDDKDYYIYGPIQSFTTGKADESIEETGINIYSTGNYPWIKDIDEEDGAEYWVSGNYHVNNSNSELTMEVTHNAGQTLSFYLAVSSEEECDYVSVYVGDDNKPKCSLSGAYNSQFFNYTFEDSGTTIVRVVYQKDESVNGNDDSALVAEVQLN